MSTPGPSNLLRKAGSTKPPDETRDDEIQVLASMYEGNFKHVGPKWSPGSSKDMYQCGLDVITPPGYKTALLALRQAQASVQGLQKELVGASKQSKKLKQAMDKVESLKPAAVRQDRFIIELTGADGSTWALIECRAPPAYPVQPATFKVLQSKELSDDGVEKLNKIMKDESEALAGKDNLPYITDVLSLAERSMPDLPTATEELHAIYMKGLAQKKKEEEEAKRLEKLQADVERQEEMNMRLKRVEDERKRMLEGVGDDDDDDEEEEEEDWRRKEEDDDSGYDRDEYDESLSGGKKSSIYSGGAKRRKTEAPSEHGEDDEDEEEDGSDVENSGSEDEYGDEDDDDNYTERSEDDEDEDDDDGCSENDDSTPEHSGDDDDRWRRKTQSHASARKSSNVSSSTSSSAKALSRDGSPNLGPLKDTSSSSKSKNKTEGKRSVDVSGLLAGTGFDSYLDGGGWGMDEKADILAVAPLLRLKSTDSDPERVEEAKKMVVQSLQKKEKERIRSKEKGKRKGKEKERGKAKSTEDRAARGDTTSSAGERERDKRKGAGDEGNGDPWARSRDTDRARKAKAKARDRERNTARRDRYDDSGYDYDGIFGRVEDDVGKGGNGSGAKEKGKGKEAEKNIKREKDKEKDRGKDREKERTKEKDKDKGAKKDKKDRHDKHDREREVEKGKGDKYRNNEESKVTGKDKDKGKEKEKEKDKDKDKGRGHGSKSKHRDRGGIESLDSYSRTSTSPSLTSYTSPPSMSPTTSTMTSTGSIPFSLPAPASSPQGAPGYPPIHLVRGRSEESIVRLNTSQPSRSRTAEDQGGLSPTSSLSIPSNRASGKGGSVTRSVIDPVGSTTKARGSGVHKGDATYMYDDDEDSNDEDDSDDGDEGKTHAPSDTDWEKEFANPFGDLFTTPISSSSPMKLSQQRDKVGLDSPKLVATSPVLKPQTTPVIAPVSTTQGSKPTTKDPRGSGGSGGSGSSTNGTNVLTSSLAKTTPKFGPMRFGLGRGDDDDEGEDDEDEDEDEDEDQSEEDEDGDDGDGDDVGFEFMSPLDMRNISSGLGQGGLAVSSSSMGKQDTTSTLSRRPSVTTGGGNTSVSGGAKELSIRREQSSGMSGLNTTTKQASPGSSITASTRHTHPLSSSSGEQESKQRTPSTVAGTQPSRLLTDYANLQKLGKGGQGTVFIGQNKVDTKTYAIKRIKLRRNNPCMY